MSTSFSTALSALSADTTAIDVVGNNLANLDTTGFKTSTLSFYDLVTQSLGAGLGATQVGFGVGPPATLVDFSQGAIQATTQPLDAAIQGEGFFVVQTADGQTEYTRGGSFEVNTAGDLTTATGETVQGWTAVNGVLNTNAPIGNITVPVGSLEPPVATTTASVSLNLDSSQTAPGTPNTFSTSVQVYDSLGNAHVVTFTFTQTSTPNQWTYTASLPSGDAATVTPATGTLTFDSNGNLISPAPTDPQPLISATGMNDGAADMNITWNLYNGGTSTITQYAETSAASAAAQNGAAAANLTSVGLGNGGQILAQYSDGNQVVVGQVAMATIRNPESLIAVGDNNYQLSANTALPAVGLPDSGGRGQVIGGSIESSNVDIATEFTNLIVFQRGYEANAKVVTTADQLSQDTINLKQ